MPNHKQPGDAPVYGIRPQKPGMYLGLFHGRDTPNEAMNGWGFDGPALGPLKHVHTTYACSMNVEFTSQSDAHLLTGSNDTFLELQLDGDLLCFGGKLYGDWTVYMVKPEECFRPPDTFRQNTRPNDLCRQAKPIPWPDDR
jgi:hypothetical protein